MVPLFISVCVFRMVIDIALVDEGITADGKGLFRVHAFIVPGGSPDPFGFILIKTVQMSSDCYFFPVQDALFKAQCHGLVMGRVTSGKIPVLSLERVKAKLPLFVPGQCHFLISLFCDDVPVLCPVREFYRNAIIGLIKPSCQVVGIEPGLKVIPDVGLVRILVFLAADL